MNTLPIELVTLILDPACGLLLKFVCKAWKFVVDDLKSKYGRYDSFIREIWKPLKLGLQEWHVQYIMFCVSYCEHVNVLEWAVSTLSMPKEKKNIICKIASYRNAVNTLKWIGDVHIRFAVAGGSVEALSTCNQNCDKFMGIAGAHNRKNVLKWHYRKYKTLSHSIEIAAAQQGHIEILKWVITKRPLRDTVINVAIGCGKKEVVEFLLQKGLAFNANSARCAVTVGLDMLSFVVSKGCDLINIDAAAIRANKVDILQWGYNNGSIVPQQALLRIATKIGHLEVVKWLCAHGIHPTLHDLEVAAKYGHLEIVKYYILAKVPSSTGLYTISHVYGRHEILKWLDSIRFVSP